jgi:hypothetical protein
MLTYICMYVCFHYESFSITLMVARLWHANQKTHTVALLRAVCRASLRKSMSERLILTLTYVKM